MTKRDGSSLTKRLSDLEAAVNARARESAEAAQRMAESDRAMRGYFTDEMGRLREAITSELYVQAVLRLLSDLLPILNDLDSLLERPEFTLCPEAMSDDTARLQKALLAYRRRFYNGLRRLGVEEMAVAVGETLFDPHLHEGVEPDEGDQLGDTGALPEGTIIRVLRKGYLFRNELFQAPQVVVK